MEKLMEKFLNKLRVGLVLVMIKFYSVSCHLAALNPQQRFADVCFSSQKLSLFEPCC